MAAIDKRKAVQAALAYTQQRRFDKAIAEYKNALSVDPQDLAICKKLGDLYAQTGAIQEAITTYMKLGDLFRADGLAVKAIAIYKMVLNLDPKNMQIYLACADLYAEQGLVGEAKIQYMTVAEHYTRAGEARKALEVFEKIASLDPTNYAIAAKVGEMYEREHLGEAAVAHYAGAAKAAARSGHAREAADFYNRALRLQPQAFEPLLGLGRLHFDAGKFREAASTLEGAAAAAPENPIPLAMLGQCYRKLGDPGRAEAALRRAVEADPAAAESRIELARCLAELGRPDEAWEEFSAAADRLLEEGRGEEAQEVVQGLAGDGFGGAEALAKLADIYQRLGRDQEAHEVQRRLADRYAREARPAEAAAVYRSLLEAFPEDPELLARLEALGETAPEAAREAAGAAPDGVTLVEPDAPADLAEPATPRVISIAAAVEPPGEDMALLDDGEEGLGLFGGEGPEMPAAAAQDDDASEVAEQLAEADVYLKYGLIEKAAERLRETLAEFPGNVAARARLRKLYLDEGRAADAAAETLTLADTLAARGQADRAAQELETLQGEQPELAGVRERLQRLRRGPAAPPPPAAPAPPAPAPEGAVTEAVYTLDGVPDLAEAAMPPEAPAPVLLEPPAEPEAQAEPLSPSPEEAVGMPVAPPEGPEADVLDLSSLLRLGDEEGAAPAAPTEPEAEEAFRLDLSGTDDEPGGEFRFDLATDAAASDLSLDLREAVGEDAVQALRIGRQEPSAEEAETPALALEGPDDDLEEAEFFRTQGMRTEAEASYRRVLEREPGNTRAQAGLAALRPAAPAAETEAEASFTLEESLALTRPESGPAEVRGEEALETLDLEGAFPPAAPAEVPPPAAMAPADEVLLLEALLVAPPPAPPDEAPSALELPAPVEPPADPAAPAGAFPDDTWIPGPGPFILEESQELDMAPAEVAPPTPPEGPGVDLVDVDLAAAPPAEEEATVSLASLDEVDVLPSPGPPPEPSELSPPPEAAVPPPPPPPEPQPDVPSSPWRVAPLPPPGVAPPPPLPPRRIGPAEEIAIFRVAEPADEPTPGGFVDLGAEIQREIDAPPRIPPAEGAALLDELLDEFQKGVRQHLDAEDYETHYNLGIAYREMDLFDEAIEEFRLARKDSTRALTCSGLIALCLLAKGQAPGAIEELTRALALPGYTPEQYHGLRYDLATAFEAAGQEGLALELLEALAASTPPFRDTADRLAALRHRQGRPGEPSEAPPAAPPGPAPPPAAEAEDAPPPAPAKKPARPRRDKISFV